MARSRRRARLSVWLYGRNVGKLSRTASGAIYFAYVDSWLG